MKEQMDIVRDCFNKGHLYDVIHVLSTYPAIHFVHFSQSKLTTKIISLLAEAIRLVGSFNNSTISLKVLRNDLIRGHC